MEIVTADGITALPSFATADVLCVDVETTGKYWWKDRVFGISVSGVWGGSIHVGYSDIRKTPAALHRIKDELHRAKVLVNHNIKFDWHMLMNEGVVFPSRVECTMVREALLDEHRLTYDLDSVARDRAGVRKHSDIYQKLADLFGGKPTRNAQIGNLHRAPASLVAPYANGDTIAALKVWLRQEPVIESSGLRRVHEVEMQLLPVLLRMERRGVRVDVATAERVAHEIGRKAITLQRELDGMAGFPVNPNPSGSIKRLFEPEKIMQVDDNGVETHYWRLNDGTVAESTDAGGPSIDADCLRRMKHPAASKILVLRKMLKAKTTFIEGHILGHQHNGKVHANFNQTKSDNGLGTGTGRLSVNEPALQQIPARDKEMAQLVRPIFMPEYGHDWVCNDWAQMDFRVFGHYVNDSKINAIYSANPDADFHQSAADLTGLPRSPRFAGDPNAKAINLGMVFGMGEGRMAQEMGLPSSVESRVGRDGQVTTWVKAGEEATAVFARYHEAIPGVKSLLTNASAVARSRGYVKTALGRHIRFPGGRFTHKAGGLIFQGTAADCLKVKLVELDGYLESYGRGSALLLNVHDEFDTSVPTGATDIHAEISRLVTAFGPNDEIPLRVPVRTDQGIGPNWWEASK